MTDRELLNTAQVANWLQISTGTLRNWRTAGRGPRAVKIGGHVRYRVTDVAAWIDQNAERVPARLGRPRKAV